MVAMDPRRPHRYCAARSRERSTGGGTKDDPSVEIERVVIIYDESECLIFLFILCLIRFNDLCIVIFLSD